MNSPLPDELQRRWGNLRFIRQTSRNEWGSECPVCRDSNHHGNGDPDRFTMFAAEPGKGARGWCRNCGYFSWADEDIQAERPSPEQIEQATQERLKLLEAENQRIKEKLHRIGSADFWRKWHDDMEPRHREMWRRQGIEEHFIDYYSLGYCTDHVTFYQGQEWHSPTMTIPHYGPAWKLANIQHRLMNPPEPGDKYRQMAGVPAAMFLTEPDEPLTGGVLIVEGAKKAIVTYTHLDTKLKLSVVAIPSKTPSADMLKQLERCEPVYLALDPDAYTPSKTKDGRLLKPAVVGIAAKMEPGRVMFVNFPAKVDDMLTVYGLEGKDLLKYIERATVTV